MSHRTELLDALRKTGYRLTPQREIVLAVMAESTGHLTADAIVLRVHERYPYLHKSAVYRSLDLLAQLNLINHTNVEGRVEYELHRHPHHHHLVCRKCGARMEADDRIFDSLERTLRTNYGFQADLEHWAIVGLCRGCQPKGSAPTPPASRQMRDHAGGKKRTHRKQMEAPRC